MLKNKFTLSSPALSFRRRRNDNAGEENKNTMLWKRASLKALKFTLIVLIATSVRFVFYPETNWLVQIATAVFVFIVATGFFYFQEKRSANRKEV